LIELINDNVNGTKTTYEVEDSLHKYYETVDLSSKINQIQHECDITSARIAQLLNDESFSFRPVTLLHIHGHLFAGIYDFAGKFRTQNLTKKEPILNGKTVTYTPFQQIEDNLKYDFEEEKEFDYGSLTPEERVKRIAKFTSAIWQVHGFYEGNTRTTAVFIEKYLNTKGYNVDNELFKDNALYFRNALVRCNYTNMSENIIPKSEYLENFFDNLLNGAKHKLNNDDMLINIE